MQEKRYLLNVNSVKDSLRTLQGLSIHRHFAGYLCIKQTARAVERLDQLRPDFVGFFDRFLRVGGAPDSTPYVVPFNDRGSELWFNKNVAGSYAPSSLRINAPLKRAVDTFGARSEARFSLKSDHAEACSEFILKNNRVPAAALATYLFRDHSLTVVGDAPPTESDLLELFRNHFGFRQLVPEENNEFSILFSTEPSVIDVVFQDANEL